MHIGYMNTIEEEYPVNDMESVRQWIRREIARSEACGYHQMGRDENLSKGLLEHSKILRGLLEQASS